ncbi:prepilin-type N-terminal cleavage/methylation domain-containing protein [Erysipelotrichaceae bacterium RD49]|nr:prepilin-type N-terminal cleavage/methylation domain-containing protein [Erysipelotrichaceae bacterium RD49]
MRAFNGFTMLEMLVVMLIVVILAGSINAGHQDSSLGLFGKNLLHTIQIEQYQALAQRESRSIAIDAQSLDTPTSHQRYPSGISCSAQVITFNANGNISKGGSVTCRKSTQTIRLIFQIGSGKGRIEYD